MSIRSTLGGRAGVVFSSGAGAGTVSVPVAIAVAEEGAGAVLDGKKPGTMAGGIPSLGGMTMSWANEDVQSSGEAV